MSSRRSRSSSRRSATSSSPRSISDDQIADLLSKLQALLPEAPTRSSDRGPTTARVLQDTCSYIRSLHQEVDNLSERLAELLAAADMTSDQAAVIRSLLM